MPEPLDEQYLKWLYARIGSPRLTDKSRTYWKLMRYLYSREFVALVDNDDNRVEDGRDLRLRFLEKKKRSGIEAESWMGLGCSVLELIVALADLLAFQVDGDVDKCFWLMIGNLGLDKQNDISYNERNVEDVIERFISRTYQPNGHGGLFPLQYPQHDQREIELWYQCSEFIIERI